MDMVAGLLDGPRARDAFLLRSTLDPPWSLAVQDGAPLAIVGVVAGDARVLAGEDDADRVQLRAGDVAVVRGPEPYVVCDDPAVAPQAIILPGQECAVPPGEPGRMRMLGVRTWGTSLDGPTVLLTGVYAVGGEVSRRLLHALPRLVAVPARALDAPFLALLEAEVVRDEPGQEAVLDRLLDLLLVAVLRAWFARADAQAPGWYRAHADPVVGPALRLIHDAPQRPWTVAALAAEAGVSRAALARRFREQVGEPPLAYLTSWRLTLAADLLREPGSTLGSVAPVVGYATPYALSAAFKRVRGISPRAHREQAAAVAA